MMSGPVCNSGGGAAGSGLCLSACFSPTVPVQITDGYPSVKTASWPCE